MNDMSAPLVINCS